MALSTMNSSAKRMWQKFFLLFRIAVMSPHCSKTSWMISSVAFSGKPPTKTVLHPGGRSLVEGGGRSENHNQTQGVLPFTYFCSILFYFSFLWFTWQKSHSQTNFLYSEQWWTSRATDMDGGVRFPVPASFPPLRSSLLLCTEWLCPSMNRDKANVSIISFLLHNTEAQRTGGGWGGKPSETTKHDEMTTCWKPEAGYLLCLSGVQWSDEAERETAGNRAQYLLGWETAGLKKICFQKKLFTFKWANSQIWGRLYKKIKCTLSQHFT